MPIKPNEKLIKRVQNFCLMDDTFFNCFMADNPEGMQHVLSIIMDKKDLVVTRIETQHTIANLYARGVRFDVFATDADGREYNIEIQNANDGADPRRARYNSGMIDYRSLAAGADVTTLPETYVIFVTAKDVLAHDKPIYHIERKVIEADAAFNDGAHIVYVNGSYSDDTTELGQLIQDFKCKHADDMKSSVLAERMRLLKETESEVFRMCEIMEEYGNERETKAKAEDVVGMLKEKLPVDMIARITKLTAEQITEIGKKNSLI